MLIKVEVTKTAWLSQKEKDELQNELLKFHLPLSWSLMPTSHRRVEFRRVGPCELTRRQSAGILNGLDNKTVKNYKIKPEAKDGPYTSSVWIWCKSV